jgi:biotin operon repressor
MKQNYSYLKKKNPKCVKVLWHIVAHANLTPIQGWVYTILKSFSGKLGIYASLQTIATRANCSRRAAFTAIQALRDKDVVTIHARSIRGNRTSNLYVLIDEALAEKLAKKHLIPAPPVVQQLHSAYSAPVAQELYLNQNSDSLHEDPPQNIIPISGVKYKLPRMKPLHSRKQEQG